MHVERQDPEADSLRSASGLGRACVLDICKAGGNAAILDMNEELGRALTQELGPSARFFACDVADTDSVAAAVKSAALWVSETGKPLGGIIPAAGVGRPGLVGSASLAPASPSTGGHF